MSEPAAFRPGQGFGVGSDCLHAGFASAFLQQLLLFATTTTSNHNNDDYDDDVDFGIAVIRQHFKFNSVHF